MLTRKYNLVAKISSTPGNTQLINHFIINNEWYLVDLPGYGYAKVPKSDRKKFEKFIWDYILKRKQLTNLFVLIDSRHEPMKIDLEFINKIRNERNTFFPWFLPKQINYPVLNYRKIFWHIK